MGRESKPLPVTDASGAVIGHIVVIRFNVADATERTFELFKIASTSGGELLASSINAFFAAWLAAKGGTINNPAMLDPASMGRAFAGLAAAFPDGKAFLAWQRRWLGVETAQGDYHPRVRFHPAAKPETWIDLSGSQPWQLGGTSGTGYEHVTPGLMLTAVLYSIAVNCESFAATWGMPELAQVGTTLRQAFQELKRLLEFAGQLKALFAAVQQAAGSTPTPTESQAETPDSTGKS